MGIEKILEEAREAVKKTIPSNIEVTEVDFEGPVIVIYTKNLEEFAHNNDLVRQLAQSLRRRVAIRPDPKMLANTESAEERIRKIIPEEAKITNIYFDDDTGEVTIEAISPGLVIGKHGSVLNEIKKEIGWAPKVVRAPPIPSKTVSDIRTYLRKNQEDRKEFLRKVGKRLMRPRLTDATWLGSRSLGRYNEFGRSPGLLMTRESTVLIDGGVSVAAE